jgi:hypothetical protein
MRFITYFLLFVLTMNALAPLAEVYFGDCGVEVVNKFADDFGEDEKKETEEKAEKSFTLAPPIPDLYDAPARLKVRKSEFSQIHSLISRLHAFELDMPPELQA